MSGGSIPSFDSTTYRAHRKFHSRIVTQSTVLRKRSPHPRGIANSSVLGPQVRADTFVDELKSVGALVVEARLHNPCTHHLVEKAFPVSIAHGPDPELLRVAAINDAMLIHIVDRIAQKTMRDLRLLHFDKFVT